MSDHTLYKELARYYDYIYHFKDYKADVVKLDNLIKRYLKKPGKRLLDVACGTGEHMLYFSKKGYSCDGVDGSKPMLAVARKKMPDAHFRLGDMRSFNMRQQYDVVACLFSSIGYMRNKRDLGKAIANMAAHARPGGIVIIEPWLRLEEFQPGRPFMQTYEEADLKIVRSSMSRLRGETSVLEMHYLIAERNKRVRYLQETQEMGMFEPEVYLDAMEKADLKAKFLKNGLMRPRGLYVGVRA